MFAALCRLSPGLRLVTATLLLSGFAASMAPAKTPLLDAGCDGCHLLAPPAPEARNLRALAARKGPDLF